MSKARWLLVGIFCVMLVSMQGCAPPPIGIQDDPSFPIDRPEIRVLIRDIIEARRLNSLGQDYFRQGYYFEAEEHFMLSLANFEKSQGPEHLGVARNLIDLALLYNAQHRYNEAELSYKRALGVMEKSLGPHHLYVAGILRDYALLLRTTNRKDEAMKLESRVKAIVKHAHASWKGHMEEGVELHQAGWHAKAKKLLQTALEEAEIYGPEDQRVFLTLDKLAELYRDLSSYDEAEESYKRALAIVEKLLGARDPRVATTLEKYADFLREMERDDEAEKMETRATAIRARDGRENPMK